MTQSAVGVNTYQQVGLVSELENASPERLIQMLLGGAINQLQAARRAIKKNDVAGRGEAVSRAMDIINTLSASLDKAHSEKIVENLHNLYDYIIRQLMKTSIENNPIYLDESEKLLAEIKFAWDNILK